MSNMNTQGQPGGTTCFGISACSSLTVFVECLSQIYQGTDAELEFLVKDEEGQPIDINQILGMYIRLYGDAYTYMTFVYPDTTGTFPITVLQHEEDGEQVDVGYFSIKIPAEESAKFMTGGLYAELKFKIVDTNWPGGYKTKVISCIKLADIKLSQTKDVTDF